MFELPEQAVQSILEAGRRGAASMTAVPEDVAGLDVESVVALFFSNLSTEALRRAAIDRRGEASRRLETFSPLYLTNTCDAECRMCGMRRENAELDRQTARPSEVRRQLNVLKRRGVLAVALLTGEYRRETRGWAIGLTRDALLEAISLGFRHILVNIGSLDGQELESLFEGVPRDDQGRIGPKVTMCTFQETYHRAVYAKFMGRSDDNPRADFERRLSNFDRAADAGMRVVNPGVLLGLHPDLGYELVSVVLHVRYLVARGLEVYLSLPRLRQATGVRSSRGVSDDDFVRLVAVLSMSLPGAKIVVTTREPADVQRRVLPMVTVLSAGSSAVAPYTETGARFPLEASQFEVIDQRPIEVILQEYLDQGVTFENYLPS